MSLPGRPSTACLRCRGKKVKCDGRVPACNRCTSKHLRCPGYLDLSSSHPPAAAHRFPLAVLPSPSLEDQAIPRFLHDYVYPTVRAGVPGGYLNFLLSLDSNDRVYIASLRATAYVSLANQIRSDPLRAKAREQYGEALALINKAMQTPQSAVRDGSLAAIIVIAIFEMISQDRPEPFFWDAHHKGRILLLKMRGTKQFDTEVGRMMFRAVYSHTQIAFLSSQTAPDDLATLPFPTRDPLDERTHVEFPVIPLAQPMQQVLQLVYSVTLLTQSSLEQPRESLESLLTRLESADASLVSWANNMPALWNCQTIAVPPSFRETHLKIAFPPWLRELHFYTDMRVCMIWNFYRAARMFVYHSALRLAEIIENLTFDTEKLSIILRSQHYKRVLSKIADDICASIPFSLNQIPCDSRRQERDLQPEPVPLGGYMLLWSLHALKSKVVLNEMISNYIDNVLRFIRDKFGIYQAQVVLDRHSGKSRWNTPLWRHDLTKMPANI